jgi:ubiquitin-conjugating enzyme E2 Z
MTIHSVLTTIQSLLDDKPYTHEPGHEDNPEFNAFVQYNSWHWLLLEYLDREQDADAKAFLSQYLQKNATEMVSELERQKANHCQGTVLASPYNRGKRQVPDYDTLLADLKRRLPQPAELPGQLSGPSEAMQDTGLKRKLPFDDE